jgi:hypothetical protein
MENSYISLKDLLNTNINNSNCYDDGNINAIAIGCLMAPVSHQQAHSITHLHSNAPTLSSLSSSNSIIIDRVVVESNDNNIIRKFKYCYCCLPEDEG